MLHACATNCTLIPLLMPYLALHRAFGVRTYTATSEQARSGAGYGLLRGEVPFSFDIPGEAEKTMGELTWIAGDLHEGRSTLRPLMDRCAASAWMRPTGTSSTWCLNWRVM